jgi:hypothetical protein
MNAYALIPLDTAHIEEFRRPAPYSHFMAEFQSIGRGLRAIPADAAVVDYSPTASLLQRKHKERQARFAAKAVPDTLAPPVPWALDGDPQEEEEGEFLTRPRCARSDINRRNHAFTQDWARGKSIDFLAEKYKVLPHTVMRIARELGLPRRGRAKRGSMKR